jgi:tryptophan synthase alpha subunit
MEEVNSFLYMDSVMATTGVAEEDIKMWIQKAITAFIKPYSL